MKQNLWLLVALAALFFASCRNPVMDYDQDHEDNQNESNGAQGQAQVIFDNRDNPFMVNVYSSFYMIPGNRIATVAGGAQSEAIDFLPNPQGFTFFVRYFFSVENIGFYTVQLGGHLEVVIPGGSTTTVSIRPLAGLVDSQDTILVNRAYLSIRNNDAALLRLLRGSTIVPDTGGASEVPQHETAVFNPTLNASASMYRVWSGIDHIYLPADVTFTPGHIHFMEFGGSDVTPIRDPVAIALRNATWGYTVTFNANGAQGITPFPQRVREGSSLLLPGPGNLYNEGYSFGGWNTRADGSGQNFNVGESFTPPGNITLFARWAAFRIDFDMNEGTGTVPTQQQVPISVSIYLPDDTGFSRPGFTFAGWNTRADGGGQNFAAGAVFTPTTDTTLYAVWSFGGTAVSGPGLPVILAWLRDNAQSNGNYVIELSSTATINNTALTALPTGVNNTTITLSGGDARRTINLSPPGSGALFSIGSGLTLVLDSNIDLVGHPTNTSHLVGVNSGGTLIMNADTLIANNHNTSASEATRGGGVFVNAGGRFIMHGGSIMNNRSNVWSGGGVHVTSGGHFDMRGGTISGNFGGRGGGGVYNQGTFRISNGTIFGDGAGGNTAGPGFFGTALRGAAEHGNFITDYVFIRTNYLTSTNNTASVTNGAAQRPAGSAITMTVNNIPERYVGLYGFIALEPPGVYDFTAMSPLYRIMGTSMTFTMFEFVGTLPETEANNTPFTLAGPYLTFFGVRGTDRHERIAGYDLPQMNIPLGATVVTHGNFIPAITITVTGIPYWYHDYWARIELDNALGTHVGTSTWGQISWVGAIRVHVSHLLAGSYYVVILIYHGDEDYGSYYIYWTDVLTHLNAGENTIPWSVFDGDPLLDGNISITGTAQVGQTLGVNINNLGGTGAISFQWISGGVAIGTGSTFLLTSAHLNSTISVTVTREGYSGYVTAIAVGPVTAAPLPPLTGAVSILGTPQVGQQLTASTTLLGGSGTTSFQWMRGTTQIGTNNATYVVQTGDIGYSISVVATRTGNSGSVTSLPVGPVLAAVPPTVSRPADAIFDLATEPLFQSLAAGTTNYAQIFTMPQFITRAGGNSDIAFEVIRGANRNLLQVTASSNWAGFDLNHAGFDFRTGDVIRISGIAVTANQMLLNTDHYDWRPLGNYAMVSAGHAFTIEHTLTAPDVSAIVATNPQSIRVRGNHVESDGPATFIVTELTVRGQRDVHITPQPVSITVTGIPSRYWGNWGDMDLNLPGTGNTVGTAFVQNVGSSTTFHFDQAVHPGTYDIVLWLLDWGVAYSLPARFINAGANTIPFTAFGPVISQTTITVTGIPIRYWDHYAGIEILDSFYNFVGWSNFSRIPGPTVTFEIFTSSGLPLTGTYHVFMGIDDWWGWPVADYVIWSRNITAGSNTIPFADFGPIFFSLSEPLEPSERTAPGRSRQRRARQ